MKKVFSRPRSLKSTPFHYCAGCGHSIIHRVICEVIDELGIRGNTIGVPPAGCAVVAYNYFDVDMLEAPHGRGCAVATGIKRTLPDRVVFSYQGDGDLAAIGTAETFHAANRGENITVLFINNAVYGMTGGQMAPTTLLGQVSTTSPPGRNAILDGHPIRMSEILGKPRRHSVHRAGCRQLGPEHPPGEEGRQKGLPVPDRRRRVQYDRGPFPVPHELEDEHRRCLPVGRRGHVEDIPHRGDQGRRKRSKRCRLRPSSQASADRAS